jgi:hypothetical protein
VKIAPIGAVYKDLKMAADVPGFEVTQSSVVLPESAEIAITQ